MKKFLLLFITLTVLISCHNQKNIYEPVTKQTVNTDTLTLVPVNYDFKNYNIRLNSFLNDPLTNIEWRWDYMGSPNGMPDTLGKDCYMNISDDSFVFDGEQTLPFLGVDTYRNKIKSFSATTIFTLTDTSNTEIERLLSHLKKYDSLKTDSVRKHILKDRKYQITNQLYEEKLILKLATDGYSRLSYSIKTY